MCKKHFVFQSQAPNLALTFPRVSVAEAQARQTFDQNKDGEVTQDEARVR